MINKSFLAFAAVAAATAMTAPASADTILLRHYDLGSPGEGGGHLTPAFASYPILPSDPLNIVLAAGWESWLDQGGHRIDFTDGTGELVVRVLVNNVMIPYNDRYGYPSNLAPTYPTQTGILTVLQGSSPGGDEVPLLESVPLGSVVRVQLHFGINMEMSGWHYFEGGLGISATADQLTITAVPEPSSIGLFASALAGLAIYAAAHHRRSHRL